MNQQNYNNFLSDDEKKTLKYINDKSNVLKNRKLNKDNIFNKTLKEILTEWSIHHQKMLDEIVKLIQEVKSMDNYDKYNNWWRYFTKYLNDFVNILIKGDRMIYSGITILMISFLLFVINSSS